MFQAENQFYPTPKAIAQKMIAPYITNHRLIDRPYIHKDLLPIADFSAGKGDLLDPIAELIEKKHICAIEIDPNLRAILNEKGYKVIGSDFLKYSEPREFGLVVLNPPFRNAEQHILHAWKFVKDGGELCSLIGSHTIADEATGKYSEQLSRVIDAYGSIEHLGECFEDAERKTSVKISMIRLSKPKKETVVDFSEAAFKKDFVSDEAFSANPLAHANYLQSLVSQYQMVEKTIITRHQLNKELKFYLNGVGGDRYGSDNLDKICNVSLEDQLSEVKDRFWYEVFNKAKIASKITASFQKTFEKFRLEQKNMSFSEDNVQEMLLMFFGNYDGIMAESLITMFDKLTAYCEENKVHWEGWKTNKGYKLNKKIIYPYGVRVWSDRWGSTFTSHSDEVASDLDKILCWMSGKRYEDMAINTRQAIRDKCDVANKTKAYQGLFESDFFELRIFKKGTLHMIFKDQELLNLFNIKAAEGKNWIGGKGF